jgi:glycine/D-amino acid oxidase-like deaminating enzyme
MTFTCEPSLLLKYLTERYLTAGGKFKHDEVHRIEDVLREDFDIVINCAGLGAKYIVPDDLLHPIRGQVSRVSILKLILSGE